MGWPPSWKATRQSQQPRPQRGLGTRTRNWAKAAAGPEEPTALLWTRPDTRPQELQAGLHQTASMRERAGVRTHTYTHAHMLVTTVRTRVDPGFIMGI